MKPKRLIGFFDGVPVYEDSQLSSDSFPAGLAVVLPPELAADMDAVKAHIDHGTPLPEGFVTTEHPIFGNLTRKQWMRQRLKGLQDDPIAFAGVIGKKEFAWLCELAALGLDVPCVCGDRSSRNVIHRRTGSCSVKES
jgi:hypothetical protein